LRQREASSSKKRGKERVRATQEMTRNMIAWHEAINFLQLLLAMGMSTVLINEEKDKGLLCRNNGSTMNRKRWWERRR